MNYYLNVVILTDKVNSVGDCFDFNFNGVELRKVVPVAVNYNYLSPIGIAFLQKKNDCILADMEIYYPFKGIDNYYLNADISIKSQEIVDNINFIKECKIGSLFLTVNKNADLSILPLGAYKQSKLLNFLKKIFKRRFK